MATARGLGAKRRAHSSRHTSASAQRRWERRFTALNRATSRPSCARKVFVEERERRARVTDEGGQVQSEREKGGGAIGTGGVFF